MKPTQCTGTPHREVSNDTQERNKRHHSLRDLNKTNKTSCHKHVGLANK